MNGQTNAGGSAGGLRVVAEGTTTDKTTLPAPAALVYVRLTELQNYRYPWGILVPGTNNVTIDKNNTYIGSMSSDGTEINISSAVATPEYYYIAFA